VRIATFNVNGVNGRLPRLLEWLEETQPDIACLQELKAPQEWFPRAELERRATARSGTARKAGTASPSWGGAPSPSKPARACPAIPTTSRAAAFRGREKASDHALAGVVLKDLRPASTGHGENPEFR